MMTISMFVFTGCDPKSGPPAPAASTPEATSTTTKDTPPPVEDSGEITGPLESVRLGFFGWRGSNRQRQTGGSRHLRPGPARSNQSGSPANFLFLPTALIPMTKIPNATSFEGGSNVAQVVSAQKVNDQATLTLDDGSDEENIFPPQLFPKLGQAHPTVRIGSSLDGVTGNADEKRGQLCPGSDRTTLLDPS